jgi:hypothetical protein
MPWDSCVQAWRTLACASVTDRMEYLEDGRVLWSRSVPGTTEGLMVYAQLHAEKEGDRAEIIQLAVSGPNLTTDKLRSIPLAHIETVANTDPEFRPHLAGTPQNPMGEMFDVLRQDSNRHFLTKAHRKAQEPRTPLSRPDGSNPDGFYRQVAEAYRDVVQTTPKVAKVLAKEANVPPGTVHRWVLEARRRGFLPPARQGRAG